MDQDQENTLNTPMQDESMIVSQTVADDNETLQTGMQQLMNVTETESGMDNPNSVNSDGMMELDPLQQVVQEESDDEDELIKEINELADVWDYAPDSIVNLRNSFLTLGFEIERIQNLSLREFVHLFLFPNIIREQLLIRALKTICDDPEFWCYDVNVPEQGIEKAAIACKRWGIEKKLEVVSGYCATSINLDFWTKVTKCVNRLHKVPDSAKAILRKEWPENEDHLEWQDVIDSCFQAFMNKTTCVEMSQITSMESLLNNGMLDCSFMAKLQKSVGDAVASLSKLELVEVKIGGKEEEFQRIIQKGELICELSGEYIEFMEMNELFRKNKTEFMVFHSEEAMVVMESILRIHREFMVESTDFQIGEQFEDHPNWIP